MSKAMKILYKLQLISIVFLIISCGENQPVRESALSPQVAFDSLITYIERNGDFVNTSLAPNTISASELYSWLDSNILVIDTRTEKEFAEAHIYSSVNVPFGQLLNYFETKINPNGFNRIILVCNSGQTLTYAAAILRLLGYNNVFVLRWGLSSWHRPIAETRWIAKGSNAYAELLETKPNEKELSGEYPSIVTNEKFGYTILRERAQKLFEMGYRPTTIEVDTLFEMGHNFYIVNYWPEDYYNMGHIPGAIQYEPRTSLSRKTHLSTLPTDRPIVIYCNSGQLSSYVVAYLRLLGYDAYSLSFGTNGFMQGFMRDNAIRTVFTEDEVMNYPVVSGGVSSKPSDVEIVVTQPRGGC
jgi:rhodanese-related sulfurtransferase